MTARLPEPDRPPPSDVSHGAGLVGLAGLLAWIAFCRFYPAIADALALPGAAARCCRVRTRR